MGSTYALFPWRFRKIASRSLFRRAMQSIRGADARVGALEMLSVSSGCTLTDSSASSDWSAAVTIGGDADATEPAGKKPRKAEDMGLRLYLALAQWTGSRKVTANGGKEVVDVLVDKDERSSAERQRSTPHQKAFAVAHERYF
jgi:hypothetical protein